MEGVRSDYWPWPIGNNINGFDGVLDSIDSACCFLFLLVLSRSPPSHFQLVHVAGRSELFPLTPRAPTPPLLLLGLEPRLRRWTLLGVWTRYDRARCIHAMQKAIPFLTGRRPRGPSERHHR